MKHQNKPLTEARLDEILRAVKVPQRSRAYWRDFPKKVIERIAKKDAMVKRRAFGRSDSGNTHPRRCG